MDILLQSLKQLNSSDGSIVICPFGSLTHVPGFLKEMQDSGFTVYAIEQLQEQANKAKELDIPCVSPDVGYHRMNNIKDNQYDAAMCINFVNFCDAGLMQRVLLELIRVANGCILFSVVLTPAPEEQLADMDGIPLYVFTRQQVNEIFSRLDSKRYQWMQIDSTIAQHHQDLTKQLGYPVRTWLFTVTWKPEPLQEEAPQTGQVH